MKKIAALVFLLIAAIVQAQDTSAGAIKVSTTLHEDGTRTVTTLDSEMHTSESVTYDARDKVRQKVVYVLGENDQPQSGTVYAPNGTIIFKAVYKRDGTGRIVEEADSTPDGKLIRRFVYEYGSNSKVSRIRAYDANGNELRQSQSPAKKDVQKVPPRRGR